LTDATTSLEIAKAELEQVAGSIKEAELKVADAEAEVANLRQQYESSRPLVASLTQSGDAPAFVAQYDPLKKALLIKTALEDEDEKVPEIWLIPAQGERKGEVLSLGVMDEKAPDEVKITDEFIKLIGEGGTLAITMEPAGGSPTGVATGPVIALGKLQSF
jgi:anti-sigma-K factor RskA